MQALYKPQAFSKCRVPCFYSQGRRRSQSCYNSPHLTLVPPPRPGAPSGRKPPGGFPAGFKCSCGFCFCCVAPLRHCAPSRRAPGHDPAVSLQLAQHLHAGGAHTSGSRTHESRGWKLAFHLRPMD